MWMSYLIRSINAWFMRIVYQRDTWDVWLEKSAKIIDVRIAIVLHFARFMIWLTRRILWLFSFFGQLVSCYLLRQMEYDADLHECRLSGSKTFENTSKKMRYLAIAYQQSLADLNTFLLDGKLGDDFPMMIIFNRDQQEPTLREKIESLGRDEKTEWLATHPCDRDRIAAAQRENAPGIFAVDHPATVLFEHFEEVCKEATTSFLQAALADAFKLQMLVPLPQLLAQKIEIRDSNIALERMIGVRLQRAMPLPFPDHLELTVHNSQEAVNHLTDARQYMIDHFDEYTNAMKQMDRMHSDWLACYQAIALLELGIKPNEKDFRIPVNSVSMARQAQQELSERIQQDMLTLRPFHANMVTRFRAAHWLLLHPQSPETIEAGESTQTLALNALETLVAINDQVSHVNTLHNWFCSFSTFLSVMQGQELTRTIYTRLTDMAETLCQKMGEITQLLNVHPFPFEHADGAMDLATYLFPKKPNNQNFLEVAHATYSFIEQFHYLYFRCLGSMALVVQRVETAWKLPLQSDPIPSFNDDEAPSKGS